MNHRTRGATSRRAKVSMAVVATALSVLSSAASAHAAATGSDKAGPAARAAAHVVTAPAAPVVAAAPTAMNSTSPYVVRGDVQTGHVNPGVTYTCNYGYLCALVWDPTTNNWKIFYFYNCTTYELFYWNGWGYYLDNQTGSAITTFYDGAYHPISSTAPDRVQDSYNWGPVYWVTVC